MLCYGYKIYLVTIHTEYSPPKKKENGPLKEDPIRGLEKDLHCAGRVDRSHPAWAGRLC